MPKSRKRAGAKRKKAGGTKPPALLDVPDLATLISMMLTSERLHLGDLDPDGALDEAQDKAFDAMESPDPATRVRLAREALDLSPLCADAYLVLSGETDDPAEVLALLRQACEAGAEALGEAAFEEDVGHFWGLVETRPYMRARQHLAMELWEQGAREEAAEHYRDLLRLNPNDNQGVRYQLVDALIGLGEDDEAGRLILQYEEDSSAAMAWSAALLAFRSEARSQASGAALERAMESNRHIPDYLLGRIPLPAEPPPLVGMGDRNEAVAYVHNAGALWRETPDAIDWLGELAARPGARRH
jgi:thioredoxin-like negative regulator of GroEL